MEVSPDTLLISKFLEDFLDLPEQLRPVASRLALKLAIKQTPADSQAVPRSASTVTQNHLYDAVGDLTLSGRLSPTEEPISISAHELRYRSSKSCCINMKTKFDGVRVSTSSQSLAPDYKRRAKRLLTPEQNLIAIDEFETNPFPTVTNVEKLASQFGLTNIQIENWFQNRRYKLRIFKPRVCVQRLRPETLPIFESEFAKNPNPSPAQIAKLARDLSAPSRGVAAWFKARRNLSAI